jgi:hypothetical protein
MDMQEELKRAYEKSVTLAWAMVAALMIYPITVEIIRMRDASFEGFAPQTVHQIKDFIYGIAIVLPLCIPALRKALLQRSRSSGLGTLARRLGTTTAITILLAEMPALLGLLLFFLGGFYREFYIAFGYSILVILAYFPRYSQWERWLAGGMFS